MVGFDAPRQIDPAFGRASVGPNGVPVNPALDLTSAPSTEPAGPSPKPFSRAGIISPAPPVGQEAMHMSPALMDRLADPDLDPLTRDRLMAQAELSSRFEIVEDGVQGPRAPNQLTAAEFEKMSTMYSDVRMGASHVNIDTEGMDKKEAERFKLGAMNDIASILQTPAGRTLLENLAYRDDDHTTTLGMSRDAEGQAAPGKAFADSLDPEQRKHRSDFEGTATKVGYVPGATLAGPADATDEWKESSSDVVLFHELTHAMHMANGTLATGLVQPGAGVGVKDLAAEVPNYEHQAVGLGEFADNTVTENRYRSQRKGIGQLTTAGAKTTDGAMPQRTSYAFHQTPLVGAGRAPSPAANYAE